MYGQRNIIESRRKNVFKKGTGVDGKTKIKIEKASQDWMGFLQKF